MHLLIESFSLGIKLGRKRKNEFGSFYLGFSVLAFRFQAISYLWADLLSEKRA